MGDAVGATRPSGRLERVFGSRQFFALWIAQLISATGDWLGLLATIAVAARLSEGSEGAAIALVLASRVAPGFFLATAAGVIVDRLNRKHVMIVCDLGRALILFTLPFVNSLAGLVVASFLLEILTMMWSPAKEAVVPNLVPKDKLTTANSLNVAAAYGMFPVAAGIAALLAKFAEWLPDTGWVDWWHLNETGLAFYVDGVSFLLTALIIWRIAIPVRTREERRAGRRGSLDLGGAVRELREGWQFIAVNPIVRAVNLGLATGIIGGGMLVPLGAIFVDEVIQGDEADFNLILFRVGSGHGRGRGLRLVAAEPAQPRAGLPSRAGGRRWRPRRRGVDEQPVDHRPRSSACSGSPRARSTCSDSRCSTRTSTTTSGAGSSPRSSCSSALCLLIALAVAPPAGRVDRRSHPGVV